MHMDALEAAHTTDKAAGTIALQRRGSRALLVYWWWCYQHLHTSKPLLAATSQLPKLRSVHQHRN
jgi:hypothetical protein